MIKKLNPGYYCFLVMALIVTPLLLNSCDDDDDIYFIRRMATVRSASGNTYLLETDDGVTLWPVETEIPWYEPLDGRRVIAYYTPLDDRTTYTSSEEIPVGLPVLVRFLRNILTKQVEELTADNEAEYGDDKVSIYDMWIGGDYLNIQFAYFLPQTNAHRVSLVLNTTEEQPEDGYVHLEYRYNDRDDITPYSRMGMVSFYLGDYAPSTGTRKGIMVKINSAVNGERVLTFEYGDSSTKNTKEMHNADELEDGDKVM